MLKIFALMTGLLFLVIAGCKEKPARIDASSLNSFKTTVAAVISGLPEKDRAAFSQALLQVQVHILIGEKENLVSIANALTVIGQNQEAALSASASRLNGLTGEEVMALANELALQKKKVRLAEIDSQIGLLEDELASEKKKRQEAQSVLDKIRIEAPQYRWTKNRFMDFPFVRYTIINNSMHSIKSLKFVGRLETAGRAVPWREGVLQDFVPGGIEPGERKDLEMILVYNTPSWDGNDLKDKEGLVLTLSLIEITASDGLTISTSKSANNLEDQVTRLKKERLELASRVD